MPTSKKDLEYSKALGIAEEFLSLTKELYRKAEIAGSLRRKEPIVHDIDFAVMPSLEDFASWASLLRKRLAEIGATPISLGDVICNLRYKECQVNLFVCTREDSWGVVLMWATGPKGHTIGLTIKARARGLNYSSKGIFTREESPKLIPARSEEEVARLLDWKYKPPEWRGKGKSQPEEKEYH